MENLFEDFDFNLLASPDFKEDAVRDALIGPLLKAIGYSRGGENRITTKQKASASCNHRFKGSSANQLSRGPGETITTGKNVQQAYFYAISMMRRLEREGTFPHIDDIYLEIMPLLKNGKTPEKQTFCKQ